MPQQCCHLNSSNLAGCVVRCYKAYPHHVHFDVRVRYLAASLTKIHPTDLKWIAHITGSEKKRKEFAYPGCSTACSGLNKSIPSLLITLQQPSAKHADW